MGTVTSKLLLPLGNKTLLERTIEQILQSKYVSELLVLVRSVDEAQVRDMQFLQASSRRVHVLLGGASRQESVNLGLRFLHERGKQPAYVLVHDGARCFVSPELIDRCIEQAFEYGAVTAAVPLSDTIKKVGSENEVISTIDRQKLWLVQTPQVFRFKLLWDAHQQDVSGVTDDASLVERLSQVHVVEGERINFKITTPEDLDIAQRLLERSY